MLCSCSKLIGRPYRLGADGSGEEIDCIHLVFTVLKNLKIATPIFKESWYTASDRQIMRDLLTWGRPVDKPEYDGDVVFVYKDRPAFAVTWQTGILYINRSTNRVAWCSVNSLMTGRCFRSRSI